MGAMLLIEGEAKSTVNVGDELGAIVLDADVDGVNERVDDTTRPSFMTETTSSEVRVRSNMPSSSIAPEKLGVSTQPAPGPPGPIPT